MAWIVPLGGEFVGGLLQNVFAASADVNRGSEFEEAASHAFAEAGAAASDENAFVEKKVRAEHIVPRDIRIAPANSWFLTGLSAR